MRSINPKTQDLKSSVRKICESMFTIQTSASLPGHEVKNLIEILSLALEDLGVKGANVDDFLGMDESEFDFEAWQGRCVADLRRYEG